MSTKPDLRKLRVEPGDRVHVTWLDAAADWEDVSGRTPDDDEMGTELDRVGFVICQTEHFLFVASEISHESANWFRHTLQIPKVLLRTVRILRTKRRVL